MTTKMYSLLSAGSGERHGENRDEEESKDQDESNQHSHPNPPPMPPLEEFVRAGPQRPVERPQSTPSMTSALDSFIGRNRGRTKVEMMASYLARLSADQNDSQLLMAELTYLFFKEGEDTRVIHSSVHNCWFVWRGKWEECGAPHDPVNGLFQCELLPACCELDSCARTPQARKKFT